MPRAGRLARVLLLLAPPLLVPLAAGDQAVHLAHEAEEGVVLSGLPPILADDEVRAQLETGLTTTLLFHLEPRDRDAPTGARVEIRYELWDEVFHVAAVTADGRLERSVLASFEDLGEWWSRLKLVVVAPGTSWRAGRRARVVLDVVPFSQAERDDTERWFSEVIAAAAGSGREEVDRSPDDREESLGSVLSVLIATSIQRRALTTYQWAVQLPEEGSP